MTLEEFTILRRDELVDFFRERFGKSWRQIVARQNELHPCSLWRWKAAQPAVMCRRILKLERWARSIGFRASTDERVESKLQEQRAFKEAASQEVQRAQEKRKQASLASREPDRLDLNRQIGDALRRMRAEAASG